MTLDAAVDNEDESRRSSSTAASLHKENHETVSLQRLLYYPLGIYQYFHVFIPEYEILILFILIVCIYQAFPYIISFP